MNNYKDMFEQLAREHIKRDGLEKLLSVLEKSDFYTAPASSKHHLAEESGLVKHSINVFNILYDEIVNNNLDIPLESVAIVSLFHDICKIGTYKVSTRNTKDESGKWIQVPYYEYKDIFPIGHSEKSIIMLMHLIELTSDEIFAIRGHMGGFDKSPEVASGCFSNSQLAVLLHCADLQATYIVEKN